MNEPCGCCELGLAVCVCRMRHEELAPLFSAVRRARALAAEQARIRRNDKPTGEVIAYQAVSHILSLAV